MLVAFTAELIVYKKVPPHDASTIHCIAIMLFITVTYYPSLKRVNKPQVTRNFNCQTCSVVKQMKPNAEL